MRIGLVFWHHKWVATIQTTADWQAFTKYREYPRARSLSKGERLVLILALQPTRMLDVAALLDAFGEANQVTSESAAYSALVVSDDAARNLTAQTGLVIMASASFRECWDIADTIFVAGYDPSMAPAHKEPLIQWLQWQAARSRRVCGIAGGTLLLAEAGLLQGRKATTHWRHQEEMRSRHPRVSLERDVIYTRDGNVYTCAGATSGIDLALSLIEEDLGPSAAARVAHGTLLHFRRPGGAPQISSALRAQEAEAGPIANLLSWLPDNLQQKLSIRSMARRSAMSPRNFARTFRREVGITPAKHIENLRLEAAKAKLESTSMTVDGVAFATGFESSETLRRLFVRRMGVTPGRYRSTIHNQQQIKSQQGKTQQPKAKTATVTTTVRVHASLQALPV